MSTVPNSDDPRTLYGLIARWLTGQEAIVVVLFAILGVTSWLGYYGLTIAIPQHLQQIQKGYEQNATTLKDAVSKCCDDRKDLLEIIREQRRANAAGEVPEGIAHRIP